VKKNVLVVGVGKYREFALKTLIKREDITTILIDTYKNRGYSPLFDETFFVKDLNNYNQILILIENNTDSIDGILTFVEHLVPLTVWIANKLGLPSMDYKDSLNSRNKYKMRERISINQSINQPKYQHIKNQNDSCIQGITQFPGVVKPLDMAASIGVKRIESQKQLLDYLHHTPNYNSKGFLYEEYIDGKEYSAEGFVQNQNIELICFTEKDVDFTDGSFVEVGHILPKQFNNVLSRYLTNQVIKTIRTLRLNNCFFHLEFKLNLDNVFHFIEVGARPAGDFICSLIFYALGINPYNIIIDLSLGRKVETVVRDNKISGIRFLLGDEDLSLLEKVDQKKLINLNNYNTLSSERHMVNSNIDRLGYLQIIGDEYEEVVNTFNKLYENKYENKRGDYIE
jgi:biotin carboxylase